MEGKHQMCFLCDTHEWDHLFITCPMLCLVWGAAYFTFIIPPSTNITIKLAIDKNTKPHICVGVCALVSAI
jgi:hypothetical protein